MTQPHGHPQHGHPPDHAVAVLEHLTGPSRGTLTWLTRDLAMVWMDGRRLFLDDDVPKRQAIAELRWIGRTYAIQPQGKTPVWVNGRRSAGCDLRHGDVIEFGETGPISRFRLIGERRTIYGAITDIFGDSVAYLRSSRRPVFSRIAWAAGDAGRRLALETTWTFRLFVVLAIVGLAVFSYIQYRTTVDLRADIARGNVALEGVAADLARARKESIRSSDLSALRDELASGVSTNRDRLEALERASDATRRVIAEAYPAVALLQGTYGMRHLPTGKMLRHVLSPQGIPLIGPNGRPLLTVLGDGPIAEIQFTGTAFLLKDTQLLISNRHVALPWETGTGAEALTAQGLEPVMQKFVAYFPGLPDAIPVTVAEASETTDLAVLAMAQPAPQVPGLSLSPQPPPVGAEIVVIGYPTGLRSLLAQSGRDFIEALQKSGETDFFAVAERLARSGLIAPLASRGIVGQTTGAAIVYDAETTHGGSGGPVLNAQGQVVAVNAAILPEFGGSNLGVPAGLVSAFLQELDAGE